MSEYDQPEVQVSDYGRARREQWMSSLRANSEMMTQAAMALHRPDHDRVTSGQAGIFGPGVDGASMAATVAARAARVGDGAGAGRELERHGGTFDHAASGPAPARVDLTRVGQHQPPGESPLARYMRERQ